jgi:hypothetical protein
MNSTMLGYCSMDRVTVRRLGTVPWHELAEAEKNSDSDYMLVERDYHGIGWLY